MRSGIINGLIGSVFLLHAFLLLGGCSSGSGSGPILPGTGQVVLRVWRVLAPGDFPDGQGNWGCRLTTSQITQAMNELLASAWIYGGNTTFVWDGTITTFTNGLDTPQIGASTRQGNDISILNTWIEMAPSSTWTSNRINIYFTGNYRVGIGMVWAVTFGPDWQSSFGTRRVIVLNDGGFEDSFGERESLARIYNIIEHEMCHYLARFNGRTFSIPGSPRTYTPGEHTGFHSMTQTTQNVLRDGGVSKDGMSWPYPLIIPGLSSVNGTEKKEIFDRIKAGLWNSP